MVALEFNLNDSFIDISRRTYSQRRQNQAAKKIQQFMKKTHLK